MTETTILGKVFETATTIVGTIDADGGTIHLEPPRVRLPGEGKTLTWRFLGVPEGLRPALAFRAYRAAVGHLVRAGGPRGPFAGLRYGAADEIVGTVGTELPGEHDYYVALVPVDDSVAWIRELSCLNCPAGGLIGDPGPGGG